MTLFRKKKTTGPKYGVDVVSRDTFNEAELKDEHNGRRIVEAFFDPVTGDYGIVTIEKEEQA